MGLYAIAFVGYLKYVCLDINNVNGNGNMVLGLLYKSL
jgi:hypothetical protein